MSLGSYALLSGRLVDTRTHTRRYGQNPATMHDCSLDLPDDVASELLPQGTAFQSWRNPWSWLVQSMVQAELLQPISLSVRLGNTLLLHSSE
jgi:hypothetical protein